MQQLARLLRTLRHPDYVLGRFFRFRQAYARVRRSLAGLRCRPSPVRLSDNYQDVITHEAQPSPSLVRSTRSMPEHVENLIRHSYSDGISLSSDVVAAITEASRRNELRVHGDRKISWQDFSEGGERKRVAIATVVQSSEIPEVQQIATDTSVVDVVDRYLGYPARRVESWLFWSPANEMASADRESVYQTIRFHYDVHGYNFMYVNFYLVDTDELSGAHVLVPGTHRAKHWRHLLGSVRLTEEQVRDAFGQDSPRTMSGAAGSGFFEDTSCYHKALPPVSDDRLMLQLRYR